MKLLFLYLFVSAFCFSQIHVRGSEVAFPLVQEIAKAFHEHNKDLTILVSSTSNNHGLMSVREGQSDIAMSCRPVKTAEILKFEEKKLKLVETPIAVEPVVAVVSKSSKIKNITFADLKKIYSGKLNSWSAVSPEGVGNIEIFSLDEKHPVNAFLHDLVPLTTPNKTYTNVNDLYKDFLKTQTGIALIPLSFFKMHHNLLKILPISFDSETFYDVEKIESDLVAYPLTRQIYFYHVRSDANLQSFIEFVKSEKGKRIVNSNGYYPIP